MWFNPKQELIMKWLWKKSIIMFKSSFYKVSFRGQKRNTKNNIEERGRENPQSMLSGPGSSRPHCLGREVRGREKGRKVGYFLHSEPPQSMFLGVTWRAGHVCTCGWQILWPEVRLPSRITRGWTLTITHVRWDSACKRDDKGKYPWTRCRKLRWLCLGSSSIELSNRARSPASCWGWVLRGWGRQSKHHQRQGVF